MSGPVREESQPSRLVTRIHVALALILGVGALLLMVGGCGGSDMCPGPVLGLFAGAALLVLLVGLAIRAFAGRSSPIVVLDVLAASVLAPAVLGSVLSAYINVASLVAVVLVGLLLAGAVLAVREVATHRLERMATVAILVFLIGLMAVGGGGRAVAVVAPLIVLFAAIRVPSVMPSTEPG